jgi:hypothetical protein
MYQLKIDTSALPWSQGGWPGVSMKMLQQVESTGGMTGMMRMEAGSSIRHTATHTPTRWCSWSKGTSSKTA